MKYRFIWLFIAVLCSAATFGQITIKGTVKDKGAIPVPGVNITVKGTSQSTVSNFDGNYSISVPNRNAQLEFSFIGFSNKTVQIGEKNTIDVVMEELNQTLDEIVVVGYVKWLKRVMLPVLFLQ